MRRIIFLALLTTASCSGDSRSASDEAPRANRADTRAQDGVPTDASPAKAPMQVPQARPSGSVVHTEFQSNDAKATSEFLAALFGIAAHESATPAGPLYGFEVANQPSFAVRNAADHEGGPGTTAYFETTDLEATLEKAERNGAKVIVPKMPFAGKGHIAWVEAPGGVRMAFLQHDPNVEPALGAAHP